jgi:hypothetical protein
VFNQPTTSMMFATIANQAAYLAKYHSNETKYFDHFEQTISDLTYKLSFMLQGDQALQFNAGGVQVIVRHLITRGVQNGSLVVSALGTTISLSRSNIEDYQDGVLSITSLPSSLYADTASILSGNVYQYHMYGIINQQIIDMEVNYDVNVTLPVNLNLSIANL